MNSEKKEEEMKCIHYAQFLIPCAETDGSEQNEKQQQEKDDDDDDEFKIYLSCQCQVAKKCLGQSVQNSGEQEYKRYYIHI
ncbi:hypothetical protein M0813_20433 [Anaeramoeba flamelloides]|uniref:Uncharacterized protein n=1 Tax=Anaeramoeba flamelloides TaxID=1746091 RepID=A0ABQ8YLL4_9EUKA|nr:hypothetical protein M0813_20433 [Anaeramoeba flamelloides]